MPADADIAAAWDETAPANGDSLALADDQIRGLRMGVKDRLDKEHVAFAGSTAGGEHKEGSGKVYYQAGAPTTKPDGATSLDSADEGRLWVNSANDEAHCRTASAWNRLSTGSPLAFFRHSVAAGTNGGGFAVGDWRDRPISEPEFYDSHGLASVSANVITLAAGTWYIEAWAEAHRVSEHALRLYRTTNTPAAITGLSAMVACSNKDSALKSDQQHATIKGVFINAASNGYKLQHQCSFDRASDSDAGGAWGMGYRVNFAAISAPEVYCEILLWKLSSATS